MNIPIIQKSNITRFCRRLLCLFFSSFYTLSVSAAGIAVMEQSVKELGHAFSGAPTNIGDGSMVFFNPAAMSKVQGGLVSLAGYAVLPSATFHNSSSQLSPLLGGAPLHGGDGGNSPAPVPIPNFYIVKKLNERFAAGLGINIPFGMQSSYNSDWKGRYQALDSELATVNFNPAVSLKITEQWSVGAGLDVQYLKSRLTNAIDLGTVCMQALGPIACAGQGLLPQTADGHVTLKGDSVGVGYNVGIIFTPNENTRFGASYRSKVHHEVHSNANFTVPDSAVVLTQGDRFVDTKANNSVTLPDNVMFGFFRRINPQWAFSADAMWTRWSHIQELRTRFSSAQPDDVIDLRWKNTWRYAFGISYTPIIDKLTLRTGFAYDESPVPDASHRSPRIPDNDRYWITTGVTYAAFKNINLHAAYAHLFINDATINRTGTTGDRLAGQYLEHINIFGLQLDWRF